MNLVNQLKLGDHVAFFYTSRAEQLSWMIPYIKTGLERNERCIYIADDNSVPLILSKLKEAGVDLDDAQKRQSLRVTTKRETYLRHGIFEPEKMIADLKLEVQSAIEAGFKGLRATGEMTWALDLPSALSRLLEYEMLLHSQFTSEFLALCQYDETRFSDSIIEGMIKTHPVVIRNGELSRNLVVSGPDAVPA